MAVITNPQTGKITLAQKGQNSVIVTMDKLLSDIGVESFAIYMDGQKVGTTKSQTFTYTFKGNDFLGKHVFSVKTVYPGGQDFDFAEKSITVKDVTAPKAGKISLTQTASSQVKISISGFSDNAGIDRYDIYLGSKKLAGILVEGAMGNGGETPYIITGMGINVYKNAISEEISDIATSIENETGLQAEREKLAAEIIREFLDATEKMTEEELFEAYSSRSFVVGQSVTVMKLSGSYPAKVLELLPDYSLKLQKENSETEILFTGEVSLKIK
jgi:hypothetical protein